MCEVCDQFVISLYEVCMKFSHNLFLFFYVILSVIGAEKKSPPDKKKVVPQKKGDDWVMAPWQRTPSNRIMCLYTNKKCPLIGQNIKEMSRSDLVAVKDSCKFKNCCHVCHVNPFKNDSSLRREGTNSEVIGCIFLEDVEGMVGKPEMKGDSCFTYNS